MVPVPGVSLDLMSGTEILQRLKERSNEVLTRYLPCVDFLVQCQQELRKGLQVATTKRYTHPMFREALTPREFHTQYIAQLPDRFFQKYSPLMTTKNLMDAYKELQTLVSNSQKAESQGCEVVKNTFLGGMKDGESWGLRKWLSKHGGALHICNDTECLSTACQKLDRELDTTRKLAERLRPMAKSALKKLKSDIPSSYQEQSSAHPYLPFFHRLECALRGMSNFDPEDDDVICIIDDDEVEELKAKAKAKAKVAAATATASSAVSSSSKRKRLRKTSKNSQSSNGKQSSETNNSNSNGNGNNRSKKRKEHQDGAVNDYDDDDDSEIEVLEQKPAAKRSSSKTKNKAAANAKDFSADSLTAGLAAGLIDSTIEANDDVGGLLLEDHADEDLNIDLGNGLGMDDFLKGLDSNDDGYNFDELESNSGDDEFRIGDTSNISSYDANELADGLDSLASLFDSDQYDKVRPENITNLDSFWDKSYPYACALRLFSEMLRSPQCSGLFLESVDQGELLQEEMIPYTRIVKHPLCFRDICSALLQDINQSDSNISCSNGVLPSETTLVKWNMWRGMELLQAIDLVFLNSLAYGKANEGVSKSNTRSTTNKFRKLLWAGIREVIDASIGSNGSVEERRKNTPTRRGESSGFVVHKALGVT